MTLQGLSQSSKIIDSTCLPNTQLILALKKIEQAELVKNQCELLIARYEKESALLNKRIDDRDSIVSFLREKEKIAIEIRESLTRQIAIADQQIKSCAATVKALGKSLKRSKTKTFITGIAGITGMAALTILLLK